MNYSGVNIVTQSEGAITTMHTAFTGYMNQQFLEELGKKTRRGLLAAVGAGRSGGGRCYGYRTTGKRGVLEVEPDQAEVVRKIFERYVAGASARQIAAELNAAGQQGPRGGGWTAASINGSRRTGDGILHQKLYIGVRVFNRREYRKHPDSGRRSGVLRPQGEWIEALVPELRILDDELWNAAQDQKAKMSVVPRHYARRPKRLLSGVMRCSVCSGAMTLQGDRYACSAHRERGTCTNARTVNANNLESRVLAGLRDHLLSADAVAQAVRAMQAEYAIRIRSQASTVDNAERKLAEADRRIDQIIRAIEEGYASTSLKERLRDLEAQKLALAGEISSAKAAAPAFEIHPAAADGYRRLVDNLLTNLNAPAGNDARAALRRLVGEVKFIPLAGRGQYALEVCGLAAELFRSPKQGPKNDKTSQAETCEVMVGAGAGFEPATFRL